MGGGGGGANDVARTAHEVFQSGAQGTEPGSALGVLEPAGLHQLVQLGGTHVCGHVQSVSLLQPLVQLNMSTINIVKKRFSKKKKLFGMKPRKIRYDGSFLVAVTLDIRTVTCDIIEKKFLSN